MFGAPDGMYVRFTNEAEYEGPRTSFGFVRKGEYRKIMGTNWSCTPGHFSLWNDAPVRILIRSGRIDIMPKYEHSSFGHDIWVGAAETGPDADIRAIAQKINDYLNRNTYWRPIHPSPGYYDLSRWSYNPESETWSFQ